MKHILIFLLLLLLAVGCSAPNSPTKNTFIIGVSQCSEDMWRTTVNSEMIREASLYSNIELVIKSVRDDTQGQIRDIEELLAANIDLLIVSPNEAEAITPIVSMAHRNGTPVILFDRKINSEEYTAYIGADNYQLAHELGLYVAETLKGHGNVVEMRGWRGATADIERHSGFIDALSQYPDIRVIGELRGNFLRDEAQTQMMEFLRHNDQPIDIVVAMNDQMALGSHAAAINFSGNRPFIVGIDALAGEGGGIESILNGIIDASFIYPTGGDKVIALAHSILTGGSFHRENILNTAVVDKSNARVILLQTDQIAQLQKKIDKTNSSLSSTMVLYTNQRMMLIGSIVLLVLIFALLFTQFMAIKAKARINRTLEKQNREIRKQAEILALQKEQLIGLQGQLEESTQAKLVFFTNISHEFRTPLSLILGPVETLMSDSTMAPQQQELLSLMHRNSRRLLHLISEVIEFRTIECGKMKSTFVRTDLALMLRELSDSFIDYASRRRVSFSFGCNAPELEAVVDREKVEKIYFNLLSNAFKHTPPESEICVTLSLDTLNEETCAKIAVLNRGTVIPADQLDSIFERFYKINANDSGTGIGLALTRALVEDVHRGQISVESSEQNGTIFTVTIPTQQPDAEASSSKYSIFIPAIDVDLLDTCQTTDPSAIFSDALHEGVSNPIALIVEDNADLRRYMQMILSSDYTIIEAEDGGQGVEMAKKHIPDIIISDVMMPGTDGFELCRQIKEHVTTSHIPLILLTACSLDEQKAIGFEHGADAYIPKPFNAHLLKIRARKLIESRRKIKEAFGNTLINDTNQPTLAQAEQQFLDSFRKYVNGEISNPDLNVDDIAKAMGLSRVQLYRKIKSMTNYPPNELIRIIRLKKASLTLTGTGKTIAEVAYETGFSSPSYFTKCFKEFYKKSPTEYIEDSK